MLGDGKYREVKDLKPDDSLMPLYRAIFKKGYISINTLNGNGNFNKKQWQPEHVYIVEHFAKRHLNHCDDPPKNEIVHHINFNPSDNRLSNLKLWNEKDHRIYHAKVNNEKKWANPDWREQHSRDHSKYMTENNPAFRVDITFELIDKLVRETLSKNEPISGVHLHKKLGVSKALIINRIHKATKIKTFPEYFKSIDPNYKDPSIDKWMKSSPAHIIHERLKTITFEKVDEFCRSKIKEPSLSIYEVGTNFACLACNIKRLIISAGYKNWTAYIKSINPRWPKFPRARTAELIKKCKEAAAQFPNNHKVKSIEPAGEMLLYDLTTDVHHNIAAGTEVIWEERSNSTIKMMQGIVFIHQSEMDSHAAVFAAGNIYADETVNRDEYGDILRIYSSNPQIKVTLESLFHDVLNVDFNLWNWTRNLVKFGDQFLLVDHHIDYGVLNVLPMPVNEIEREEGFDDKDPLLYRFRWLTQGNRTLDPWQVVHIRHLGNDNFLPYGLSIYEGARRTWRQLVLLEDAIMVYRIVRSPERRVFYIDVGGIDPTDVPSYMEQVKGRMKRNAVIDSDKGTRDLRFNPLNIQDDYWIPTRSDATTTRIDSLPGGQYVGDIDDLNYFKSKLYSALGLPKAYLGEEGDIGSKSSLSQIDVVFSRTIERIQRILITELNKIAIIHLFSMGYNDQDLVNFNITMANPSAISEIQRLELWRTRFEAAGTAQEGIFDRRFAYKRLFKLTDEEIEAIEEGKRKDKLFDLELEGMQPPAEETSPDEVAPEAQKGEETPSEEEAPPEGDEGETPITAGVQNLGQEHEARDPNQQKVAPNELLGRGEKKRQNRSTPSLLKHAFNLKKTGMDPKDSNAWLRRVAAAPFAESKERLLAESKELELADIIDDPIKMQSRMASLYKVKRVIEKSEQLQEARKKSLVLKSSDGDNKQTKS